MCRNLMRVEKHLEMPRIAKYRPADPAYAETSQTSHSLIKDHTRSDPVHIDTALEVTQFPSSVILSSHLCFHLIQAGASPDMIESRSSCSLYILERSLPPCRLGCCTTWAVRGTCAAATPTRPHDYVLLCQGTVTTKR